MNFVRTLSAALLLGTTLLQPAHAAVEPLDRIVAIVDKDVVMATQLDKRIKMVRLQMQENNAPIPPETVLESQVLERLIVENLQLQMASRGGVRIDERTLDQAIADIAQRNKMSLAEFRRELSQEGLTYDEVREQIRNEMIISRVRQASVGERIQISDREVDNYLASSAGQAQNQVAYHLGHILISLPDAAMPDQVSDAEKKATRLIQKLNQGADFSQLAMAESAGSKALEGGDLGWRTLDQLPTLAASIIPQLQVGDIAGPVRSASGFHIIKLIAKRGEQKVLQNQVHVRHILIQPNEIRTDIEAQKLAEAIYRRLQQGERFADLARVYSNDPGSSLAGGDLGWIDPKTLVPAFQEAMAKAPLQQVTKPFRSPYGWHMLEVLERRAQDMSNDFRRQQVREQLSSRKYEEELQNWLREIRNEAFVEIKL